ncbi:MAG TPA: ergothioneine biosynthesis protein EgtB [Phycisphaerae bacterium]|nr:ergothioneine biosynthesis protein EgtB [Phycisphaerae bacterium]
MSSVALLPTLQRKASLRRSTLLAHYRTTRRRSEMLCSPLEAEDYQLQSMPDCSPPKWHLAHSTWFFETFLLAQHDPCFQPFHAKFCFLFNSYYNAVGDRWPRPARGLLSRPTVGEVYAYRRAIDERVLAILTAVDDRTLETIAPFIELGLNHEEQHQELLLTDLKHAFGLNPLAPVYAPLPEAAQIAQTPLTWAHHEAGVRWFGHGGPAFAFDNEGPMHRSFLPAFEISSRTVSCGEFLQFIEDNGYENPRWWLSDGWAARQCNNWTAPLHWHRDGPETDWYLFTLHGNQPFNPTEPVCHLSFYEADAYARWAGVRLPTEYEWEVAAGQSTASGQFLDSGLFHPANTGNSLYGAVWVWTASPYIAYPGYRPASGALGEYNGKFMCNQIVLRGGSCVTPPRHIRATYRNYFPPDARWQFSGLRLAKDATT